MKKLAITLLLIFSLCMPAHAVNFVEILKLDDRVVMVDTDSIEKRTSPGNEYLVAWVQYIDLDIHSDNFGGYALEFCALNKKARQIQLLSWQTYDSNGKKIDGRSQPFLGINYEEIIPGTIGTIVYEFVMKYKK